MQIIPNCIPKSPFNALSGTPVTVPLILAVGASTTEALYVAVGSFPLQRLILQSIIQLIV